MSREGTTPGLLLPTDGVADPRSPRILSGLKTNDEFMGDGQVRRVMVAVQSLEGLVGRQDAMENSFLQVRILCDQGYILLVRLFIQRF